MTTCWNEPAHIFSQMKTGHSFVKLPLKVLALNDDSNENWEHRPTGNAPDAVRGRGRIPVPHKQSKLWIGDPNWPLPIRFQIGCRFCKETSLGIRQQLLHLLCVSVSVPQQFSLSFQIPLGNLAHPHCLVRLISPSLAYYYLTPRWYNFRKPFELISMKDTIQKCKHCTILHSIFCPGIYLVHFT